MRIDAGEEGKALLPIQIFIILFIKGCCMTPLHVVVAEQRLGCHSSCFSPSSLGLHRQLMLLLLMLVQHSSLMIGGNLLLGAVAAGDALDLKGIRANEMCRRRRRQRERER